MIPVTKIYLPNKNKYKAYVDEIYSSGHLTNSGPLLNELEKRLSEFLGIKHVICLANGSLALQVAYKSLGLSGDVITTPFSFAATSSTLKWEGLTPIYCDIDKESWNIDCNLIEKKITETTSAIVPVHVFGNPCEVEDINNIAKKHNLKIIYDAAHAFDVMYKNKNVLNYGDISTLSFHATKIFHTIEGGAIITDSDELAEKVRSLINFGIKSSNDFLPIGTNAKMNEFEAAMGLCVLDEIGHIYDDRQRVINIYKRELSNKVKFQSVSCKSSQSLSYFPILLDNEESLNLIIKKMNSSGIFPRRYFYPSLDLVYGSGSDCNVSRDISSRILCLPLYHGISEEDVMKIIGCI
ncbi:DegT/DnrJ/EryC1/StrS family aminotransferase [Vibrio splendidus]